MTSKRELRERLQDALDRNRDAWDEGYTKGFTYAASLAVGDPRPWAEHLARVADAARAEGRRAGWSEAWTEGWLLSEDAYSRGYAAAVADWQPPKGSHA